VAQQHASEDTPERRGDGRFDGFDLVARSGAVAGSFDARSRERLVDQLAPGVATVAYRITGTHDALGHPALAVELDGALPQTCQRCLEPFVLAVKQRSVVLLARDDDELARLDENDEHEVVLAAGALDPRDLVEDELLLSLPYAPRHAEGECPAGTVGGDAEAASARTPFGALAALKARPGPQS
jgi:uncharacterized protein